MNTADVSEMLPSLLAEAGLPNDPTREPMRVWAHSGVERLRFTNGTSVVFKYADTPFDTEHSALRLAAAYNLPVPQVLAAQKRSGLLAMLMDDLGEPFREANDAEGARAAVILHSVPNVDLNELAKVDTAALVAMPQRIGDRFTRLGLSVAGEQIHALRAVASSRAAGCEIAPFGLCHSEFHPTSLHIGGRNSWHLLDFARAFIGPGLFDLASWHGTLDDPNPVRTLSLMESYVSLGGHPGALASRGGLDAASWALGWHRVWVADWFAEQIERGWAKESEEIWTTAITRHLTEAVVPLKA